MTQTDLWLNKYQAVVAFIESNKRNPSKHRIEEHLMLNWVKHNRKLLKAGKMAPERVEMMGKLVELWEENKRKNQYQ
jgi:hypothetical protein